MSFMTYSPKIGTEKVSRKDAKAQRLYVADDLGNVVSNKL